MTMEDGKAVMPHFMVGVMLQGRWEEHVGMGIYTVKVMELTLQP